MSDIKPHRINTVGEYHRLMELPQPQHPLISVLKFEDIKRQPSGGRHRLVNNFYSIALKKTFGAKMTYGQQEYDFDNGVLAFIAPQQVISVVYDQHQEVNHTGWLLLIHPDFLWNTLLASKIKQYDYFGYHLNEALHLSEREEALLTAIMQKVATEYHTNIDKFSQDVIIAQLALLLTYSERFYQRQFITRKIANHQILNRLEELLSDYFSGEDVSLKGIPTVQYFANELHLSANYLSRLLSTLTGQSTKHFIQDKVIDLAKEKLSTTDLSVSEIAYALGFEHLPSFSKLFKTKTTVSPLEFRQSFNRAGLSTAPKK